MKTTKKTNLNRIWILSATSLILAAIAPALALADSTGASTALPADSNSHEIKVGPWRIERRDFEAKAEAGLRILDGEKGERAAARFLYKFHVGGDKDTDGDEFEILTLDADLNWKGDRQESLKRVEQTGRDRLRVGAVGLARGTYVWNDAPDTQDEKDRVSHLNKWVGELSDAYSKACSPDLKVRNEKDCTRVIGKIAEFNQKNGRQEADLSGFSNPKHPGKIVGLQAVRASYVREEAPTLDRRESAVEVDGLNLNVHRAFRVNDTLPMDIFYSMTPYLRIGEIHNGKAYSKVAGGVQLELGMGLQIPKVGELRDSARFEYEQVGAGYGHRASAFSVNNRVELKNIADTGVFVGYTLEHDRTHGVHQTGANTGTNDGESFDEGRNKQNAHFITAGYAY